MDELIGHLKIRERVHLTGRYKLVEHLQKIFLVWGSPQSPLSPPISSLEKLCIETIQFVWFVNHSIEYYFVMYES